MDITKIDELWVDIPKVRNRNDAIAAISNTGKYRRLDGTIGILSLRQKTSYRGKLEHCYRIIAEHFLITVKRPDQTCIDHITHHPSGYNVNNILNLRWCNNTENANFEEAKFNRSGSRSHRWKGENVGPHGAYYRALMKYRSNPSQENLAALEEARLKWNEEKRSRRAIKLAHISQVSPNQPEQ
jgi:hypothetical protein